MNASERTLQAVGDLVRELGPGHAAIRLLGIATLVLRCNGVSAKNAHSVLISALQAPPEPLDARPN
jgi:hypothetical protein